MKKILFLSAAVLSALLIALASFFGSGLVSINAFSLCPFVLFFVIAVTGIGNVRFKDEEDDKLTKEECSLPIKTVAKIRHSSGIAVLIGCIPELFLIFFLEGILKAALSVAVMILSFLLMRAVYSYEMKKALTNTEK